MNTRISIYFLAFSLPVLAHASKPLHQSPPPLTPAPKPIPIEKILTPAQIQELKTDHAAVVKANPGFTAQEKILQNQVQADREAKLPVSAGLEAQLRQHEMAVQEAIVSYDPKAAPLVAKIRAAHAQQHC